MNTVEDFVVGSCGKPVPQYEVRIHDEHDAPVGPGVQGEIVVRPRQPHVMVEEYYGHPVATLEAFRNLWFHTGDRGHQDDDGNFYFVDRMKDCIRRRGEHLLLGAGEGARVHGGSRGGGRDRCAIGVERGGGVGDREAQEGHSLRPEEILDQVSDRMPHFAVPRYVRFTDELPKTPSQRIEKFKLREAGLVPGTWDREEHGY